MAAHPLARRARLRGWLRAWLLALLVGAAAIGTAEGLRARLHEVEIQAVRRQAQVGANLAHQIVLRRLEAVDVLHRLGQSWARLGAAGNAQGQAAIQAELAGTANARHFGIVQVALIGRDGWMLWSSVPGAATSVWLGDREHFRVHAEGLDALFVSQPLLGRVSNRWTLQLTRPLHGPDGGFDGVVVVSMDLLDLTAALEESWLRPGDHAAVLRGTMLAARTNARAAAIGSEIPAADPLRAAIARESGTLHRVATSGAGVITGWRALAGTPLVALYSIEVEAALADLDRIATLLRATAGAFAVLALMLVGLLMAREDRRAARAAAERAEAERRLAMAAEGTWRRRLSGLPAVVHGGEAAADGTLAMTHVSDSAARVIGWRAEEVLEGGDWRALMEPEEAARQPAFLRGVLAAGAGQREFRLRRPDGEWIWVRDSVRVVDARPGGGAEIIGYVADISAMRAMQARAQANAKLATLGEMATGLAHELNQPLAVMSLAAENASRALARGGEAALASVEERLGRIGQQARRARDIVDHLRVFGRPDEGALEPVSLPAAVAGAVLLTNGALRGAGIELVQALPEELPAVRARLVPLEQALVNLLLNARDAIEDRAPATRRVRIAAGRDGGAVWLSVADSGGGVPAGVTDRVFEPFFTTKPPGRGTGLGLPLVHAAMRGFGGAVTVANDAEGAVFTLTFHAAADAS